MEDNIEEDKIANKVLEGLPPSFLVFGTKKDLDPLEEFWMNKLTNIEKQYDQHVIELERKVLKDRANRRSIKKQAVKISKLNDELTEQVAEVEKLKYHTGSLDARLKDKEYEAKSFQDKFEKAATISKKLSQRMEDERQTRRESEKQCSDLKKKLRVLEKEKARMLLDMDIVTEKGRVEERESALHKERWAFVRNLSEIDAECRIQTNANVKLCEDMEKLLGIEKSLEIGLLKERRTMSEMMGELKVQRQEHQNALRQLDMMVKEKRDVQESLVYSVQRTEDLKRNVNHWKEELELREEDNAAQNREIGDLKRRNSNIRCILADTKHKLGACMSEMKSLDNEKRRADVELRSAKLYEKSLQLEIKKNELRKFKLAEKILKAYPTLLQQRSSGGGVHVNESGQKARPCAARTDIEGYRKRIWKLERHKGEVERKLRELQRKENIYRVKLDKYAGMEKQIFWTGKAMAKMEGDRNRLEQLLKTMESNMPMKVPFKKLVTDPSVLDRLAKNKVLHKRIFHQSEKIEELKSSARRLLQFREEQFGALDRLHGEDIPTWKLAYWNKNGITPENVLSGINLDIIRTFPEKSLKPLTDQKSYKNYMQHLNEEIPKLKLEIDQLERRKFYIEADREKADSSKPKGKGVKVDGGGEGDGVKMSTLLLTQERPVAEEPSEGSEHGGGDNGQCTPELSMHGSSYAGPPAVKNTAVEKEGGGGKLPGKTRKQAAPTGSSTSATEDERDDVEEGSSSEAASEIPSDKS